MLLLKNVEEAVAEKGLSNPGFPFLDSNPTYVRLLMYQPVGAIVAAADQLRVQDRNLLTAQMKAFLGRAVETGADLTTCPEYSCTWAALVEGVENDSFPADGKLWALGCESATSAELRAALNRLAAKTTVIFDESVLEKNGNFVDCLVYLFRTNAYGSTESVPTVLVQTKTQPMGGNTFELANLKTGNILYRFRNATAQSNSLVGLICSDTLHPEFEQYIPRLRTDTFVLHLQLNDNPSTPGFTKYRNDCCTHVPRTAEILCLNWARGTTIVGSDGSATPFILEPKSILFRDKQQVIDEEAHVMSNDAKGCYLTNWEKHRTAAFLFSPDPHLFLLETTKPLVVGHAATARRTGPRMIELRAWDGNPGAWQPTTANDRFEAYWMTDYPALHTLLHPLLPQYLEAERLIHLSIGHASGMEWDGLWKLQSFELAEDDTTRRLTLCWSTSGDGRQYRDNCLSLFRGFADILADTSHFSNRLTAFKGKQFQITYKRDALAKRFRNFHLPNGRSATGIFVGFAPTTERLAEVKKRTMDGLHQTESDTQLLAIWYRDPSGQLQDFLDQDIPTITSDPGIGPVAIDNTDP